MCLLMCSDISRILKLELPILVQIGELTMPVKDVTALQPGSIIELPKLAEEPLDLLVNNKAIGNGTAVKVGENFGIQLDYIGDVRDRIAALGGAEAEGESTEGGGSDDDADATALAEAMLAGQL